MQVNVFFINFCCQDPYNYVEEQGEDLPTVAAIKRVKLSVNPQVSKLIQQFDEDIADEPDLEEGEEEFEDDGDLESEVEMKNSCLQEESHDTKSITEKTKKPMPRLISIKDLSEYEKEGGDRLEDRRAPRKRPAGGQYGPLVSGRAHTVAGTRDQLKRCRVDVDRLGLDLIADEPVSVSGSDLLNIAKSQCQLNLFEKLKVSFDRSDTFTDFDIVFTDGKMRVHKVVLAATSPFLLDLLTDVSVDSLVFPDISLAEGRMAVEALYSGDVKISPRSLSSLSSLERCLRRFQDVGLLENYSIQISPLLPLSRFNPTKAQVVRPQSPQSPPPPRPPSTDEALTETTEESVLTVKTDGGDSEVTSHPAQDEVRPDKEVRADTDSEAGGKKRNSPVKLDNARKDCNKPRWVSLEAVEEKDKEAAPRDVVSWLMDAGFLCSVPPLCKGCGEQTLLHESSDVDSLAWKCPSKELCLPGSSKSSLLREHSIFQYSKDKLLAIMRIILHWRDNTSLSQCHLVSTNLQTDSRQALYDFLITGDGS